MHTDTVKCNLSLSCFLTLCCYININEMTIKHCVGGQCLDVDECQTDNGGCQMRCENSFGSFKCLCAVGYTLTVRTD